MNIELGFQVAGVVLLTVIFIWGFKMTVQWILGIDRIMDKLEEIRKECE